MNIETIKRKAENGDLKSQEKLAWFYDRTRSWKKAFYWYEKAASNGANPIIYYNLSLCYLLGLGTGRDYEKAFYWTKKAAALGYCDAVLALAWHYHNGFGIRKDLKSAKRCYSACFATEYSDSAYFGMGQIAYEDDGDYKAAFEFFMNAARKGHAKACYFLGRMYFEGRGVEKDAMQAGIFLKKAIRKEPRAKRLLKSRKFKRSGV